MKKIRLYRKKNRLFFKEMGLLEQMGCKVDKFRGCCGPPPKFIYLPEKEYKEYSSYFKDQRIVKFMTLSGRKFKLAFRGIEVRKL